MNLTVAVFAPPGFARDLGKKGTTSDITFYNLRRGADTITFVEPTRYPDRLAPLFFAASMADMAILVVEELTAAFGEQVLMLECAHITSGLLILKNFLTPAEVAPYIAGTVVEGYTVVEEDMTALREHLVAHAQTESGRPAESKITGTVAIDQHFHVKGIGTVVLGGVVEGCIRKHDALTVLPEGQQCVVRSIQKHDDDAEIACTGDRVGLALKQIAAEELDRGYVLSSREDLQVASAIAGEAHLVPCWPSPLKQGMVLHLGHWMQFIPARIEEVSDRGDWRRPVLSLSLDGKLVHAPGDEAVLHFLDGGKLRVAGTIRLA